MLWVQSETRIQNWLIDSRRNSESGTTIGLGALDQMNTLIRPNHVRTHFGRHPSSNQGPGSFKGGSFSKYGELLEEWQTGRKSSTCDDSDWGRNYTKLHSDVSIRCVRNPEPISPPFAATRLCRGKHR